ncbi:uncharacterized protein PG986_013190 [Apiospora aurea]|uniref:Uncharacterized protein n=1 Tax=Apiospora aurea TaxID=335848 RepID=A0ABR1PUW1_9PEZI
MAASTIDAPEPDIPAADTGPVDSPVTPSSQDALARFEFETGRGNEGTKILLVEWNPATGDSGRPDAPVCSEQDGWEVSWEGKTTKIPAQSERDGSETQRVYFLIPSDITVPPVIQISHFRSGRVLSTKPMPAIYTPALGVDTRKDVGKRGVLHTIWAKKRMSQLQNEIRREMGNNSEGIALVMAVQERDWIAEHFGLPNPDAAGQAPDTRHIPPTPQSPRSPVGGRLGEKLRGLKLVTNASDFTTSSPGKSPSPMHSTDLVYFSLYLFAPTRGEALCSWFFLGHQQHHLYSLSPDTSDIAIPSTTAFAAGVAKMGTPGTVASLNAIVSGDEPGAKSQETEDELFMLPMSPRSPEMKKSPFSLL